MMSYVYIHMPQYVEMVLAWLKTPPINDTYIGVYIDMTQCIDMLL